MREDSRIRKHADFRKLFKEGKRFSSPHFVLYIRKAGLGSSRFAAGIAKAHIKLATRRNRLRRVAREEFRNTLAPMVTKYDILLVSKKNPNEKLARMTITAQEIRKLINNAKEGLVNG